MNTTKNTPDTKTPEPAPAPALAPALAEIDTPPPGNDNAVRGGIPDTTPLVASPDVVRHLRATLRRRRQTEVRRKYDAGLCEEPDAYGRPTLYWEARDPVDTKRYLAVLGELFESGRMPEHGAEILWGEAEQVPHAEIAAEIGVTETVVDNRLYRMRRTFRARLAALGLLTLLLLLVAVLAAPVGGVSAPAPRGEPTERVAPVRSVPAPDAGTPRDSGNSSFSVRGNRAVAH
jgi:hypothetical protein